MNLNLNLNLNLLLVVLVLGGCATAKMGDKATESELKKLQPVSDKVSLYVCRANAFAGGGVGAEVFVNGKSIGALKTNTFAHTVVEPGKVNVFLRGTGIGANSGDSGTLTLDLVAGQTKVVWAGQAGLIGPVTVDDFPSQSEGAACVRGAEYAVP